MGMCPEDLPPVALNLPEVAGPVPSPRGRPPASLPVLHVSSCSQETLSTRGQTNLLIPGPEGSRPARASLPLPIFSPARWTETGGDPGSAGAIRWPFPRMWEG